MKPAEITAHEEVYRAAREAYTNGEWIGGERKNGWTIAKEVYDMLQEACERYEQEEGAKFAVAQTYKDAGMTDPAAIIAMHERHRAEVDAIKRHLDECEIAMPGGSTNWTLADRVQLACFVATVEAESEIAERRAEIERLTAWVRELPIANFAAGGRERDASARADAADEEAERLTRELRESHLQEISTTGQLQSAQTEIGRLMKDLNAAEAVVAAAQKRVGELEGRVNNVIREYEAARITDNELATNLVRLAHGTERVALAGPKEIDNG